MIALLFIAAAALCLAIGTAEIARRLTLPQAFMLTALPWGLLTAGAFESGAPLWVVFVGDVVVAAVTAGRLTWPGEAS